MKIHISRQPALPFSVKFNVSKMVLKVLFLTVAILLTLSGTLMYSRLNGNYFPQTTLYYLFLLFCLASVFLWARHLSNRSVILSGLLSIYLLVHAVLSDTSASEYIKDIVFPFFCCLFFCSEVIEKKKTDYLLSTFSDLVCVFAGISLFCWIFGSLLDVLPGRSAGTYYWAKENFKTYHYYYLYFENPIQATQLGSNCIPRNTGIYMEAPGYSSVLSTAFLIELTARKPKNQYKIILLILTLLSTQSTKAFIFLLETAVFFVYFRINNYRHKQTKIFLFISIFVAAVLGAGAIVYMLMVDKSETGSFAIRMDDIQATLKTFAEHPVFGSGYNNTDPIIEKMQYFGRYEGVSMGILVILAEGGLYLFVFYLVSYILFYQRMKKNGMKKEALLIGMILFTDLLISNIEFSARYILITSLGYAYGMQRIIKR